MTSCRCLDTPPHPPTHTPTHAHTHTVDDIVTQPATAHPNDLLPHFATLATATRAGLKCGWHLCSGHFLSAVGGAQFPPPLPSDSPPAGGSCGWCHGPYADCCDGRLHGLGCVAVGRDLADICCRECALWRPRARRACYPGHSTARCARYHSQHHDVNSLCPSLCPSLCSPPSQPF